MDTKKFILEVFKSGSTDEYLVRSEFYNSEDLKKICSLYCDKITSIYERLKSIESAEKS